MVSSGIMTAAPWRDLPLPEAIPLNANRDTPPFFKAWGNGPKEVIIVGQGGTLLRGNAEDGFEVVNTPDNKTLFTVHYANGRFYAVGGDTQGVLWTMHDGGVQDETPNNAGLIQGIWATDTGDVWATGARGALFRKVGDGPFEQEDTVIASDVASLHAIWVDPEGGVWAAGGEVLTADLNQGILIYGQHDKVASSIPGTLNLTYIPELPPDTCPPEQVAPHPSGSIARRWNEQLLNSVRRDLPRPTVHARNLFHLSAALWDVWAAYDTQAKGYLIREKFSSPDIAAARAEAMSYAAYRILSHRYRDAIGGTVSQDCYDKFMLELGFDPSFTDAESESGRSLGNRIGQAYIAAFANDGSNEAMDYAGPDAYQSESPRLVVDEPGSGTDDPMVWQQIVLAEAVTQNGIPEGAGIREYIGPHWGDVTPFALTRNATGEPYFDVSAQAPKNLDDELLDAIVEVLRYTNELDVDDGAVIDISPGALGNHPLGTNDGVGHPFNPTTGEPYGANKVLEVTLLDSWPSFGRTVQSLRLPLATGIHSPTI